MFVFFFLKILKITKKANTKMTSGELIVYFMCKQI